MHQLDALHASVARLRTVLDGLSADDLERRAYPSEWTVSDVVSHLGSGAIILRNSAIAALTGVPAAADFNQGVWDEWNAKPTAARRTELLAADQALLDTFDSLTSEQQASFQVSMGPMQLDLAAFVGMRLNEHALHLWDIEATFDDAAALAPTSADVVIDNLQMVSRWAGKPDGAVRSLHVHTTAPERHFHLTTTADSVSLAVAEAGDTGKADLELPSEAFVRLVYGRLDISHTPSGVTELDVLDALRSVFRGV